MAFAGRQDGESSCPSRSRLAPPHGGAARSSQCGPNSLPAASCYWRTGWSSQGWLNCTTGDRSVSPKSVPSGLPCSRSKALNRPQSAALGLEWPQRLRVTGAAPRLAQCSPTTSTAPCPPRRRRPQGQKPPICPVPHVLDAIVRRRSTASEPQDRPLNLQSPATIVDLEHPKVSSFVRSYASNLMARAQRRRQLLGPWDAS